MTPDEVRLLDNRYALLFIRGERPVMDDKLDILKHPNVGGSADGRGKPYQHGEADYSIGSGCVAGYRPAPEQSENPESKIEIEVLSELDLQQYFEEMEKQFE